MSAADPGPPALVECYQPHTRILRIALAVEDARSYWENIDPTVPPLARPELAFEKRWFGAKSLERVRYLLATFAQRYDAFPEALSVLCRWRAMDPSTRQLICHWHLQLSDPIYRTFAGRFLPSRRGGREPKIDRDAIFRWVKDEFPDRWSASTAVQFASKLLSAASEAGLVSSKGATRTVLLPRVPDVALAYLLYVLRTVRIEGTLLENPYLASVGLTEGFLDVRLRGLPSLGFRRMAHLVEWNWAHGGLSDWAAAEVHA